MGDVTLSATTTLTISPETIVSWATEFAPQVAKSQAVSKHQFWYSWNDVAAACSQVLTEETARLKNAIDNGVPAVIRAGDIKPKTLAKIMDDSWWKASGLGKYTIK